MGCWRLRGLYRSWIKPWEIRLCASLAAISLVALVVACPFLLDPAVMTLLTIYDEGWCVTVSSGHKKGASNCSWSSCQKGCTPDLYECWHVEVNFQAKVQLDDVRDEDEAKEPVMARLMPNTQGCGYPPDVVCAEFYAEYGRIGNNYTCYISRHNNTLAVTHPGYNKALDDLSLALIPLGVFCLVMAHLFLRKGICDCQTLSPEQQEVQKRIILQQMHDRQKLITKLKRMQEKEEQEYESSKGSFFMPRRKKKKKGAGGGLSSSDSLSDSNSPGASKISLDSFSTPGVPRKSAPINSQALVGPSSSTQQQTPPTLKDIRILSPKEFLVNRDSNNLRKQLLQKAESQLAMSLPGAIDDEDPSSLDKHYSFKL